MQSWEQMFYTNTCSSVKSGRNFTRIPGVDAGVRALPLVLAVLLIAGCGSSLSVSTLRATTTASRPRPTAASADPYTASLAYARCMRSHGVPHPNPDRKGDFHLTLAQERRMKTVPHERRQAAAKACFHTLKGLDMRPLSREAQRRALA